MSDFMPESSLAKRADDLSQLDPRKIETLLWGNKVENGTSFAMANMTLYTEDGQLILSVERFKPMLKSLQCGSKMVLAFNSKEQFEYAIRAWKWINDDETHKFIMIADDPGCGPDDERVPYLIHDVDYDEKNFVANLYGQEKDWQDVAQTFDLEYGSADVPNPSSRLHKRLGEWGFTKDVNLGIKHNFNRGIVNVKGSEGSMKLDCVDCGTSGSFKARLKIKVKWLKPKEVSLTIKPHNVRGDLGLEATISKKESKYTLSLSQSKKILELPIWGTKIPKIGKVGFFFKLSMGVSTDSKSKGTAKFNFGTVAKLSNSAVAKVNLADADDQKFSGWGPKFSAKKFKSKSKFKGSVNVYLQWTIGPQIKIFKKGVEAVLLAKLPQFETVIDTYNSKGSTCAKRKKSGISIDTYAGGALTIRAGTSGDTAITADLNPVPLFHKRSLELDGVGFDDLEDAGGFGIDDDDDIDFGDGQELDEIEAPRMIAVKDKVKRRDQVQREFLRPWEGIGPDGKLTDVAKRGPTELDEMDLEKRKGLGMRIQVVIYVSFSYLHSEDQFNLFHS
ncbi:hypothetical protein FQN50_003554 [Emmonsiellopsis sp. PD_5]|nr:hypothetical protein FQN50_003554 [Emmonsiellopsis sp. PD_5]